MQVPKVQSAAAALLQGLCSSASHVCPTCPAGVSTETSEVRQLVLRPSLIALSGSVKQLPSGVDIDLGKVF